MVSTPKEISRYAEAIYLASDWIMSPPKFELDTPAVVYTAMAGGRILGTLVVEKDNQAKSLSVLAIAVDQFYRRCRVGTRMVNNMLRNASAGKVRIVRAIIDPEHYEMRAFFYSLGFKERPKPEASCKIISVYDVMKSRRQSSGQ